MPETEELWDAYWTEVESSKFSVIAAQLLYEEMKKMVEIENLTEFKSYNKRHNRHIRASNKHLRKARRIHRKILRIERKQTEKEVRDDRRHRS